MRKKLHWQPEQNALLSQALKCLRRTLFAES